MSIRFKLLCVLLLIGAAAVVTTGLLGYQAGKRGLTQSAMNHLTGIRRSKARQIEGYFRTIRSQLRTLRENRIVIDGVRSFTTEFHKVDGPKPDPELRDTISDYYKTEYLPQLQKLAIFRRDLILKSICPWDAAHTLCNGRLW